MINLDQSEVRILTSSASDLLARTQLEERSMMGILPMGSPFLIRVEKFSIEINRF